MYKDYFGLKDTPFSIAPNPEYLYMSDRHREALAHLLYGIRGDGGFLLLTGEVGTGKTTVCRCLLQQVPEDVDTAFILNPKLTADEMLATICDELQITYPDNASIKVLVDRLNQFLLDSYQADRRTVVIIDEAQNLSVDVLEQLRLLTNLETNERKLLQIVLLGQPELLTILAKPELRQLSQRVTARFHLDALEPNEVVEYIQHRLEIAGARGSLFPAKVVKRIYKITGGIPRLINLVCDRALLGTYVQNRLEVDIATVNKAAKETLGPMPTNPSQWRSVSIAASVLFMIGLGLYFSQMTTIDAIDTNTTASISDPLTVSTTTQTTSQLMDNPKAEAAKMEQQLSDEGGRQSYIDDAFVPIDQQDNNVGFVRQQKTAKPIQIMTALAGFTDQASAFTRLYLLWGTEVAFSETDQPCSAAEDFGMSCYSNPGNLADIANLNRPVFVDFEIAGKPQNLLLTAIDSQTITLVGTDTEFHVNRANFLSYWDGQYTLLWRLPPGYETPTMIGDQGETVAWLSDQLAFIDLQPKQKTTSLFNRELEERVKRFQVSVGLLPDGRVGPQTWIHINSIQAQGVPLLNSPFYIGGQG